MHLWFRDVNDAFRGMVRGIADGDYREVMSKKDSRAGRVLKFEEPVTISYTRPTHSRVLINEARDCNPFFHLFEAVWMLAGSDRVESVAFYNSRMREFSDDGTTFNAPYGYRWRNHFGFDQLDWLIDNLRGNPNCRRTVLQIWDANTDTGAVDRNGLDIPCNTQAYFSIRDGRYVDLTVCNRSNDLVWGTFGANYVHMGYLLSYVACCLGLVEGYYHQFTNNLHVYTDRWYPHKWLEDDSVLDYSERGTEPADRFVYDKDRFDWECASLVGDSDSVIEPYLRTVVVPMCRAFRYHKARDYDVARGEMGRVRHDHWRAAGTAWLHKREVKRRERRNEKTGTN